MRTWHCSSATGPLWRAYLPPARMAPRQRWKQTLSIRPKEGLVKGRVEGGAPSGESKQGTEASRSVEAVSWGRGFASEIRGLSQTSLRT